MRTHDLHLRGADCTGSADAGFRSVIASDACTEMSEEMHDLALISFCHIFGQARQTRAILGFSRGEEGGGCFP